MKLSGFSEESFVLEKKLRKLTKAGLNSMLTNFDVSYDLRSRYLYQEYLPLFKACHDCESVVASVPV